MGTAHTTQDLNGNMKSYLREYFFKSGKYLSFLKQDSQNFHEALSCLKIAFVHINHSLEVNRKQFIKNKTNHKICALNGICFIEIVIIITKYQIPEY